MLLRLATYYIYSFMLLHVQFRSAQAGSSPCHLNSSQIDLLSPKFIGKTELNHELGRSAITIRVASSLGCLAFLTHLQEESSSLNIFEWLGMMDKYQNYQIWILWHVQCQSLLKATVNLSMECQAKTIISLLQLMEAWIIPQTKYGKLYPLRFHPLTPSNIELWSCFAVYVYQIFQEEQIYDHWSQFWALNL